MIKSLLILFLIYKFGGYVLFKKRRKYFNKTITGKTCQVFARKIHKRLDKCIETQDIKDGKYPKVVSLKKKA